MTMGWDLYSPSGRVGLSGPERASWIPTDKHDTPNLTLPGRYFVRPSLPRVTGKHAITNNRTLPWLPIPTEMPILRKYSIFSFVRTMLSVMDAIRPKHLLFSFAKPTQAIPFHANDKT